jgi:hypothetical protein
MNQSKEKAGSKDHFKDEIRSAFATMETPLFLTLSGNRSLDLHGWLTLVEEAISEIKGLNLSLDAFAQTRDRSVHLAVYGLPRHREAYFLEVLSRQARKVRAKKTFFLRVGGSLAYFWAHSEHSNRMIST